MAISLFTLFFFCLILSFLEDRLDKKIKLSLFIIIGIGMILTAGLREVGSTPDTEAYEEMYTGNSSLMLEELTEPTFTFISAVLNSLSLDVNALFTTYAFIFVVIWLSAIWKMSKFPMMTLTIFFSFYFMMHGMVQIRGGVAGGLLIWAIYFYSEGKKWVSLACVLAGISFHFSGAVALCLFILSNKQLYKWEKYIMYAIIPVGIVVYVTGIDISYIVPDSLGGTKLEHYRRLKEFGLESALAGYPLKVDVGIWMNMLVYMLSIYFSDYLSTKSKHFIIVLKMQAISFTCLLFLHGLSMVLASRLNGYLSVVSVLIWSSFVYLFNPIFVGKVVNACISTFRFITSFLFFALSYYYYNMI